MLVYILIHSHHSKIILPKLLGSCPQSNNQKVLSAGEIQKTLTFYQGTHVPFIPGREQHFGMVPVPERLSLPYWRHLSAGTKEVESAS